MGAYKVAGLIANVLAQDPRHWGWKKTDHIFLPEWQDSIDIEVDINIITSTCTTCTTALCRNCKFAKKYIPCLPFCSCRRNVLDQKINCEEMLLMETQMLFNPVMTKNVN